MAGTTPRLALPYPDLPEAADVPKDIKALADKVDAVVAPALVVPIGAVMLWAIAAPPTNWLICDGTAVSASYPLLQAIMANTPDLRGRVPVGPDGAAGRLDALDALGQAGGAQKHALTEAELASHRHMDPAETDMVGFIGDSGVVTGYYIPTGSSGRQIGQSDWTNYVGSNTPHNNMQPYLVMNYIIRAA